MCTNHHSSQDNVCLTVPITQLSDVAYYANRSCTVLVGSLILRNMGADVDEDALMVLAGVTKIAGPVVVDDNINIMSLVFLTSLRTAQSITITKNTNLIDARLPNLDISTQLAVKEYENYRVCPSKKAAPGLRSAVSPGTQPQIECPKRNLHFTMLSSCTYLADSITPVIAGYLNLTADQVQPYPLTACQY